MKSWPMINNADAEDQLPPAAMQRLPKGMQCAIVEDVADGRGAKGINRLRVIADDGQSAPPGFIAKMIAACSRFVS